MICLRIRIGIYILLTLLIATTLLSQKVYAEEKKNVIRVGVFNFEPYAYLNHNGKMSGYYIELFDLIAKKMNVEVDYILSDAKEWLSNLETEKVDIILGASITENRLEKFVFNKQRLAFEDYALYTNTNIDSMNFEDLNGLRFGYVAENPKSDWIFNFFKALNIEVVPVVGNDYAELENLMDNGEIDLMVDSAYSHNKYNKIYEFVGDQVYIAANKNNQNLLDDIDEAIADYYKEDKNLIPDLYNSYFDEEEKKIYKKAKLLIGIIGLFSLIYLVPKLKKLFVRKNIKNRLINDRYILYYQPIYDPIKEEIAGFEALLRLKDKNNRLISPANFIPEIEKNNMLFDITLWIMKKVMADFHEIRNYNCISNDHFYISLNLSVDEIHNNQFVEQAIELLKESKLENKRICLEIVERVGIKDLHKIINNISKLKEAGFKIAIDDFGVEYSNLDILEKLDADIIKVDKHYVDGLGQHLIKEETILFILRVAEKEEKSVVLEGVEEPEQDRIIKSFNSKDVFVQGYFYNKPMSIEDVKEL